MTGLWDLAGKQGMAQEVKRAVRHEDDAAGLAEAGPDVGRHDAAELREPLASFGRHGPGLDLHASDPPTGGQLSAIRRHPLRQLVPPRL